MKKWPINRARTRLNELIKRAAEDGAQTLTVNGKDTAVILSQEEYEQLQMNQKIKPGNLPPGLTGEDLLEIWRRGPKLEDDTLQRSINEARRLDREALK